MLQAVKTPPGPKPLPLIGNLLSFVGMDSIVGRWRDLHAQYGETVKVRLGPLDCWSFAGPQGIHDVLVTQHKVMTKGAGYNGLRKFLGEGLITTDAPHWASQRQRLNPLFSPSATEEYAGAIYDAVAVGVEELAMRAAASPEIDVGAAMLRMTMRVISRTAFGVDLALDHQHIADAIDRAFNYIATSVIRLQPPLFVPTPANLQFRRDMAVIEAFVDGLIERATAHPDATSMNGQIMRALEGNSRQMLRDEVISLYFAGFETTARTMTFLMYLLGRHPEWRARARREASAFVRPEGAAGVLRQLPLCCELVNEALRLYPPVAMLGRMPTADCEIDGNLVRAKSLVIVVPLVVQRDRRYWPAGDRFAPEPDNPLPRRLLHKGAFVPFGGGPRICLGKHFAMVEMAIATALLCQRFDWQLATQDEPELMFNGTIKPKHPLLATLAAAR